MLNSSPPAVQWFLSSRGHDAPGCGRLETDPCGSLDGLLGQLHHGNVSRERVSLVTDTNLTIDQRVLVSNAKRLGSVPELCRKDGLFGARVCPPLRSGVRGM